MPWKLFEEYGKKRVTTALVRGSLVIAIALTCLLLVYDVTYGTFFRLRFWVALAVIVYLVVMEFLIRHGRYATANWLLIILYELLMSATLLMWGINSSVGILTACFVILLPGILLRPAYILPVSLATCALIVLIHTLHYTGVVTPDLSALSVQSTYIDVASYITILAIFALVSWISSRQTEQSLGRARKAEDTVRKQNALLSKELEQESSTLRQTQLKQIRQLHKFAILGQSTAATLHELSNHLSILNLDISDLKQQNKNSKAITHAEESIQHINNMVRQARAQLSASKEAVSFNALPVIRSVIKDIRHRQQPRNTPPIRLLTKGASGFHIKGDPMALMQIITILINNAVDACANTPEGKVTLTAVRTNERLNLTVTDNGPGVSLVSRKTLFIPKESTKQSGLGVGLYIAKHLIESRFGGSIRLAASKKGAVFAVSLPLASIEKSQE